MAEINPPKSGRDGEKTTATFNLRLTPVAPLHGAGAPIDYTTEEEIEPPLRVAEVAHAPTDAPANEESNTPISAGAGSPVMNAANNESADPPITWPWDRPAQAAARTEVQFSEAPPPPLPDASLFATDVDASEPFATAEMPPARSATDILRAFTAEQNEMDYAREHGSDAQHTPGVENASTASEADFNDRNYDNAAYQYGARELAEENPPVSGDSAQFDAPPNEQSQPYGAFPAEYPAQIDAPIVGHLAQFDAPAVGHSAQFEAPAVDDSAQFAAPISQQHPQFEQPAAAPHTAEIEEHIPAQAEAIEATAGAQMPQYGAPAAEYSPHFEAPALAESPQIAEHAVDESSPYEVPVTTQFRAPDTRNIDDLFAERLAAVEAPSHRMPQFVEQLPTSQEPVAEPINFSAPPEPAAEEAPNFTQFETIDPPVHAAADEEPASIAAETRGLAAIFDAAELTEINTAPRRETAAVEQALEDASPAEAQMIARADALREEQFITSPPPLLPTDEVANSATSKITDIADSQALQAPADPTGTLVSTTSDRDAANGSNLSIAPAATGVSPRAEQTADNGEKHNQSIAAESLSGVDRATVAFSAPADAPDISAAEAPSVAATPIVRPEIISTGTVAENAVISETAISEKRASASTNAARLDDNVGGAVAADGFANIDAPGAPAAELIEAQAAELIEAQPAETIEPQPKESLEAQTAETFEVQPAELIKAQPAELIDAQPAAFADSQTTESSETQAAVSAEAAPAPATETAPGAPPADLASLARAAAIARVDPTMHGTQFAGPPGGIKGLLDKLSHVQRPQLAIHLPLPPALAGIIEKIPVRLRPIIAAVIALLIAGGVFFALRPHSAVTKSADGKAAATDAKKAEAPKKSDEKADEKKKDEKPAAEEKPKAAGAAKAAETTEAAKPKPAAKEEAAAKKPDAEKPAAEEAKKPAEKDAKAEGKAAMAEGKGAKGEAAAVVAADVAAKPLSSKELKIIRAFVPATCAIHGEELTAWNFNGGYLLCIVKHNDGPATYVLQRETDGFTFLGGSEEAPSQDALVSLGIPDPIAKTLLAHLQKLK